MINTWFTSDCYVCSKSFVRYKSQINVKNPCCSHYCANRKIIIKKKKESLEITKNTGIFQIKLTRDQYAIVDKEDHGLLLEYNWYATPNRTKKSFYAGRNDGEDERGARLKTSMHRQIMNCPAGMDVDHINGDTLDNRKINLRICTHSNNIKNQKSRGGKSKYRGVTTTCRR